MTRFRVGITAVLTCMAALAIVPSAFAHHGRISGSIDCQGVVSFTASSWQTNSVLAKTHNDVRVYVTQSNGTAVNPAQQVGGGQFKSANGFAFSGTFTLPAGVNSVKLLVKEIGSWGNGTGSSNGTHQESSTTVTRPTSGSRRLRRECRRNIEGNQSSVPAAEDRGAERQVLGCRRAPDDNRTSAEDGNSRGTPPPPPDECPNIAGNQASVPGGLIKDAAATV